MLISNSSITEVLLIGNALLVHSHQSSNSFRFLIPQLHSKTEHLSLELYCSSVNSLQPILNLESYLGIQESLTLYHTVLHAQMTTL